MDTPIVSFNSDSVRISGPKKDGTLTVSFDTGEYQQTEVAKLLIFPRDTNLKITVEVQP